MQKTGWRAITWVALVSVGLLTACTGSGGGSNQTVAGIQFQTQAVPDGGAGTLYNAVITFTTTSGAALPDRFEIRDGELPPGVSLVPDREDNNGDGFPDDDGALTGNARLIGFPRISRPTIPYNFMIKAISTGELATTPQDPTAPALAAEQSFQIIVSEGRINILNPQGTSNDPSLPPFPDVIDFVNPANPNAFFSFAFNTAGGSGNNILNVYLPRELELSVFDALMPRDPGTGQPILEDDTDETAGSGDKFLVDFSDGGMFGLQAGNTKVQIGGFQSPRGEVGRIDPLDGDWFQRTETQGGPPKNSRRDFLDSDGIGIGDNTLGTQQPILFSDYYSNVYEPTSDLVVPPAGLERRKYPFSAEQYTNAFFLGAFDPGVDITPLKYNVIVEAIDTQGTPTKVDDVIARRAYVMRVRIPDIVIDSVMIDGGTAGVDYLVFVNASGGVPPLQFELAWVDGVDDAQITPGQNVFDDFGINLDRENGGFFGAPRMSGTVDLSVRVFAEVMNPTQDPEGNAFVPTGTTDDQGRNNEWNGRHPETGETGIHKTFKIQVALPSTQSMTQANLPDGRDGTAYPAQGPALRVTGSGGVPWLFQQPRDFETGYPAAPLRNYRWEASYSQDDSFTTPDPNAPGLPNNLIIVESEFAQNNGSVTGVTTDRGFHPVRFIQTDFYLGDITAPSTGNFRSVDNFRTLSVSPDSAVYLRGAAASDGGEPGGLLEGDDQKDTGTMVPMFIASTVFSAQSGSDPVMDTNLPTQFDILPVAIPNGDTGAKANKNIPSVGGYWPAEAGSEGFWGTIGNFAWTDTQQELTWIQIPDASQTRVFLWGETRIKQYRDGSPGTANHFTRYQVYDESGSRGIFILNPQTGRWFVPGVFSNTEGDADGATFGGEFVIGASSDSDFTTLRSGTPSFGGSAFHYYDDTDEQYPQAEAHNQGLGVFMENRISAGSQSGFGWYTGSFGGTASSVAVSADGLWCATGLMGGDSQKILVWRTDGESVDAAITGQSYVTGVDGFDSDGNTITNASAIIDVGGTASNADDLLPDTLMFVEGGLIFMRYTLTGTSDYALDTIYGVNMETGDLTERSMNSDRDEIARLHVDAVDRVERIVARARQRVAHEDQAALDEHQGVG
ncbi:MAG: hypothetical protein AAGE01_22950, partial [Pseudomonadota bacterium]